MLDAVQQDPVLQREKTWPVPCLSVNNFMEMNCSVYSVMYELKLYDFCTAQDICICTVSDICRGIRCVRIRCDTVTLGCDDDLRCCSHEIPLFALCCISLCCDIAVQQYFCCDIPDCDVKYDSGLHLALQTCAKPCDGLRHALLACVRLYGPSEIPVRDYRLQD